MQIAVKSHQTCSHNLLGHHFGRSTNAEKILLATRTLLLRLCHGCRAPAHTTEKIANNCDSNAPACNALVMLVVPSGVIARVNAQRCPPVSECCHVPPRSIATITILHNNSSRAANVNCLLLTGSMHAYVKASQRGPGRDTQTVTLALSSRALP